MHSLTFGPVIFVVSKGPQSQFRHCWWCRSRHGTDFDISEIADPVVNMEDAALPPKYPNSRPLTAP